VGVINVEKNGTIYNFKMKVKYNRVKKYITKNRTLDKTHYNLVCEIHATVFSHKYFEPCTCSPSTIKGWIKDLDNYYKS